MTWLLLLLMMPRPFASQAQEHYAQKDADALRALCGREAERGAFDEADLLCRYRLYPLTEDDVHLEDIPADLPAGSARERALLSGLWGYRAARAPIHKMMTYGRRAERTIEAARALDPDDPYVLLIEGQALLFKPGFVGGDKRAALERFRRLRKIVEGDARCGISTMEAELWTWYALQKMDADEAPALRQTLLDQDPPPLYREFLLTPLKS